jgi:serine/threonine-protein kinase
MSTRACATAGDRHRRLLAALRRRIYAPKTGEFSSAFGSAAMDVLARWAEISPILDAALLLDPADRRQCVAGLCGADTALRDAVMRLLAEEERTCVPVLAATAGPLWDDLAHEFGGLTAGQAVGPYRLRRVLGRGGMSEVWVAEREDGAYAGTVALKVASLITPDRAARQRFLRERQILADLRHPNIAPILDGGELADGRPYLVMERIEGEPVDRWCETRGLTLEGRLALFDDVASAVEHAHRNLVVHRDLKPSNVLVDRDGRVRLLDFGIAALLEDTAGPELTRGEHGPLTPQFAAPEQFRPGAVTTAADVYQLGMLLYLMLTGRLPYDLSVAERTEWSRLVLEARPPRPSAVVPGSRARHLRGDLDTIVLTALHHDPGRRYGSAAQLRDDLRRHRDGHPVLARRDTWRYRLGKYARRHAAALGVTAAIVALLVVGTVTVATQARRLAVERDAARVEARTAEEVTGFLVDIFRDSAPPRGATHDVRALDVVDVGAARLDTALRDQPRVRARLLAAIGMLYNRFGATGRARPYLEEAVGILERTPDAEPRAWAAAVSELAHLTIDDGYTAAEVDALERVVAIHTDTYGAHHPATVSAVHHLATAHMWSGDMDAARREYDRALDRFAAMPVETTTAWVQLASTLAIVLQARGEVDGARALFERAHPVARRLDHAEEIFNIANYLAEIHAGAGRVDRFARLARESLDAAGEAYGEDSPHLASPLVLVGRAAHARGEYARARTHMRRGLELLAGNPHRPAGQSESLGLHLAELELDAGRADAALVIARRGAESLGELYGERTHLTALARLLTARALADLGRRDEALSVLDACLDVYATRYRRGTGHGRALAARGRLALAAGEVDAAYTDLRAAEDILAAALPAGHWRLARVRVALARACLARGDTARAADLAARTRPALAGRDDRWERELVNLAGALDR